MTDDHLIDRCDSQVAVQRVVTLLQEEQQLWAPERGPAVARSFLLREVAATPQAASPRFQFDDAKATGVIAQAWSGNEDAEQVLRGVAAGMLRRGWPLPPNLRQFTLEILEGRQPAQRRRGRKADHLRMRDTYIAMAVSGVVRLGYHPMRNREMKNRESAGDSACSIVARACAELKIYVTERRIEKIWGDHPLSRTRAVPLPLPREHAGPHQFP